MEQSASLTGQDLFDTMYDEMQEELDIHRAEVNDLRCIGISIAAPHRMRQVVFVADVALSSSEVRERDPIDSYEHDEWLFVPADSDALSEFSTQFDEHLTPAVRSWLAGNLRKW